jgi:hypothetical protein
VTVSFARRTILHGVSFEERQTCHIFAWRKRMKNLNVLADASAFIPYVKHSKQNGRVTGARQTAKRAVHAEKCTIWQLKES